MKLDELRSCMSLLAYKEVESFESAATKTLNGDVEINITTKVWYYHDSGECFSYTTKFIVKDFCVVVITLNGGNFNNYQHGWKRDNLSVRCRDSFVAKNLDQAINEYDTRLREYVDDNYGWGPCDWELSYSVA
jgi:hypothetical protein